jgi:flagellin-like protein
MTDTRRAVSPVVGTVLLLGVVVVLATGVLATAAAVDSLDDPPPTVVSEAGDLRAACDGCGSSDQVLRLRHRSGDAVDLADTALVVSLPGRDESTRLVDLPLPTNCLRDSHVEGPDIFDGRCGRVIGSLTAVGEDADGVWSAGDTLAVRLKKGAIRLAPGDTLTVELRHAPSGTVVTSATMSAVG